MSSFSKKDQNKAIFSVKKDSQGNIIVSQVAGKNGGEIRGSILRTNQGKPYLVPGYGMLIQSGSNVGDPGPGQITLAFDLDGIKDDIEKIVVASGISGITGPQGTTGQTGPQGPVGDAGEAGPSGPIGVSITDVTDNGDATITVTWDTGTEVVAVPGATVALDPTITLAPGTPASVANSGTPSAAVFEFSIPEGQIGTSVTSTVLNGNDLEITTTDYAGASNTVNVGTVVGADGLGWSNGSYNAGTGIITFDSDDGLDFTTGDLRGSNGLGWTGGSYDAGTGIVSFASADGLDFSTADLRGDPGIGWQSGDSFVYYVPIIASPVTITVPVGSSAGTNSFTIGETGFHLSDYNISTATQVLTWDLMAKAKIIADGADEYANIDIILQYFKESTSTWTDSISGYYSNANPLTVASTAIAEFGMTFIAEDGSNPADDHPTQWRLRFSVDGIDSGGDGIVDEEFTATIHMARIKVKYTVP